jgi:hypothetical protein
MEVDRQGWSGDGDFTIRLLEVLEGVDGVAAVRVEDASASRVDVGYNLIANEIFITFATELRLVPSRWLGFLPIRRRVPVSCMTLAMLDAQLASVPDVGAADYSDEGMLQFLRTERVIPPYQTRGYKLVELVRIYAVSPSAN